MTKPQMREVFSMLPGFPFDAMCVINTEQQWRWRGNITSVKSIKANMLLKKVPLET